MKTFFCIGLFLALSVVVRGQEMFTIKVTVENATSDKGSVLFGLHNENTFMKAKELQGGATAIENGQCSFIFENVVPGTYAVIALHDANDNKRMDFEVTGMPKEDYAVSNNPMSFGPPRFSEAAFDLKDQDLELMLRF